VNLRLAVPYFTGYDPAGGSQYKYKVWARDIAGGKSSKAGAGTFGPPP